MNLKSIGAYVQAGLDESIVKFFWGMLASAIIGGLTYASKHVIHISTVEAVAAMSGGVATSAILSAGHWLKTTAGAAPAAQAPATVLGDGSVITA